MNLLRRSVRRRLARRLRRTSAHLVATTAALAVALPLTAGSAHAAPGAPRAASAAPAAVGSVDDGELRILLFYKTNFHASWDEARDAITQLTNQLATEYGQGVDIEATDNPAAFTPENLATKDAVVFDQTGGVLFDEAQRAALEGYITAGGGFAGVHYTGWSVGQSEHDVNPFYARLVGAVSEGHPEDPGVRPGDAVVKDADHPLTQGLQARVNRSDEWYDWVVNPAPHVKTLVEADESSYGMGRQGSSHPITWCQPVESGRSWYTGLGHTEASYQTDDFVRTQLKHGIAYAAGLLEADCSPPAKAEAGEWSGVTPWPLMPINMALTSDGMVQSFGSRSSRGGDPTPYDWTGDSTIYQGGQVDIDVWDPSVVRTVGNVMAGVVPNATYTDLFCSMQVQNSHNGATMTVGGDDGLGENAPNDGAVGVTSYSTGKGLRNEAPMNYARWYPTGTTMPDGDIVVQGGSLRGGPGGPGVLTPEVYTPDEGTGWKLLTGARSAAAYGDGGPDGNGPDENRWWYPRAFVAPGSGHLFNISGTQMFELDPDADDGAGALTLRGRLPQSVAAQGPGLGNPVGATSTAVMYEPGKILQVGGGWWANGGGPAGARAGFTVDITGGTESPVVAPTAPMEYQRHWATGTVMPDGKVIVTGGSRDNNGNGGYVTEAEVWDPVTGEWSTIAVPYEHARLYHSTALLLPDGRLMIGGGGAPGPRNYRDVEFYSPAYLFDEDGERADRPEITEAPGKIGYDGTFGIEASGTVSRVTLIRNGSVTHGFNNDQNFQDLEFTQAAGSGEVTITAPQDGTYAPPGTYMLFVFDEDGTPSVAEMLDIDPEVEMDSRTPHVVEQFEYPRFPAGGGPNVVELAAGSGQAAPWAVESAVQLVRGLAPGMGALGFTGAHLALGAEGDLSRPIRGLDPGRAYRISLRYARDSRSAAGLGAANAELSIGSLTETLTAGTDLPSQGDGLDVVFGKWSGTFTAGQRTETLRLAAGAGEAGMMIDDLVIVGADPGVGDVPVHYEFEEGEGTAAANTGTDSSVGPATLTGTTGWSEDGVLGGSIDLPGGANTNAVDLPDDLLRGETDFSTSFWVRPDVQPTDWAGLFHIGTGTGNTGGYFQIQTETRAGGDTGLAATFKAPGAASPTNPEERIRATPAQDLRVGEWNHVAFTRTGSTGTLYLNGEQIGQRTDLTVDLAEVGANTESNWLGRNGFPDAPFNGQMDEVRVYGSALTAADVDGLYVEGSALDTTVDVAVTPASPSPFGEPVTVSATVEDSAGADPTGVAELWIDGAREGGQVEVDAGAATFPAVVLAPRSHEIEVRFIAGEGWRDSAASVSHTVARPPVGEGVPVHYTFDEGTGTTAANSGSDPAIGDATLQGNAGWTPTARFGAGLNLPGAGHVDLPDDITEGMDEEITISTWIRPTALPNWTTHVQIGKGTQEFLLLQSSTDSGNRGFAATLRVNDGEQYRVWLDGETDLPLNQWTHVVVTYGPSPSGGGTTGRVYFNGVLQAGGERHNIPINIGDVGDGGTNANFIGNTSWPDPRPTEQLDDFRIYGYELSAEQVVELFEGDANAAPVGVADDYTTPEGETLVVGAEDGVLDNDTDAEGDPLTATSVTPAGHGLVEVAEDGSFTYTPDAGFAGEDTFTYRAHDGTSTSATTTVTITVEDEDVEPPNTAPVAGDDRFDAVAGEQLTVGVPGVLGNDTDEDPGDTEALTASVDSQPADGTVALAADGSFTYVPAAGFVGEDRFTYTASDGTDTSEPASVTVIVKPAGGTGGGLLTSAVAGAAMPYTYGTAGSLAVSVAPAEATGRVEVRNGSDVLAAAILASGQARLELPATGLQPGTHRLTLRYVGDSAHKASSSQVAIVVDKVVPEMTVKAPASVRKGKRATIRVVLRAPDGVPVTGDVLVAVRGGRTVAGTLKDGRVFLQLPKAKRRMRLSVTYEGSALAESTSERLRVKVRKGRKR